MAFFRKLFRGNQTAPLSDDELEPGVPMAAAGEAPERREDALPAHAVESAGWDEGAPDGAAPAGSSPAIGPTAPLRPPDDGPDEAAPGVAAAQEHDLQLGTRPLLPAAPSRQGLAAAALRDVGRVRAINQDSVFTLLSALPRESADIPLGLFIVADGMGGHEGGEVASRLAVASVAQHVLGELVLPALNDAFGAALQPLMVEAVELANRTIWQQGRALGTDMGTTCTAVLLLGSALYIGHVGDSRAYVLEHGGLRQLTNDHSAVGRLIQMGQLDPSEAREHPLRNQLYRTVGQHPDVNVEFVYHPLGAASHLLLGSDGLWGMVHEAEMAAALREAAWPLDACRALVARANDAGGEDNISAVVVALPVAGTELA